MEAKIEGGHMLLKQEEISPRYLKMCQEAKILQNNWVPSRGDCFMLSSHVSVNTCFMLNYNPKLMVESIPNVLPPTNGWWHHDIGGIVEPFPAEFIAKDRCVWLPRIDQIMDLAAADVGDEFFDFGEMGDWYNGNHRSSKHGYSNTEIMLMFYMEVVGRMEWNNEKNVWDA